MSAVITTLAQHQSFSWNCDDRNGFEFRMLRASDGDFHLQVVPAAGHEHPEWYAACQNASVRIRMPEVGGGAHPHLWEALAQVVRQEIAPAAPATSASDAECDALRTQLEAQRQELQAVLDDWSELIKAIGARCHGTAIGHAKQVVLERNQLRQQVTELKGAMAAQDEREQQAGVLCGISWVEHGCDWPDAIADHVLALRARIVAAETTSR